ncbi:LVIVD repeat-containing protein [Halomarina halobia]|uniref:LVIVD repeat-containing protein n=1 Tax=Halomarina halobia TaxID=3033386 RepID=A0ABD6A8Z6_9EURY|nr:hypothetical protein [Halomarina sp. PSR21]
MSDRSTPRPRVGRRRFLRAVGAGTAALAAATSPASAHEWSDATSDAEADGDHDHADATLHGASSNVELVGYHSLGGVGPASESGSPDSPHYGAITELRVRGDYAYVGIFSSDDPTNDRGMAILDVSEFNAAGTPRELREAELSVVSFLRNDNPASAVMDVKVSDDGRYAFLSKQPYTALFGETDPTPGTDGESASVSASALQAVDVSDPAHPRIVGTYDAWDTGPHNATYHRIRGREYLFAVKDLNDGTAGLYVFEFDRPTGAVLPVNRWTVDGNLLSVGDGGLTYVHDVTVQDDPRLGAPVGYLSYWDAGLYALDLSDPTDISVLGHYSMDAAHYAEPAPAFVDGTRVVVAGQEISSVADGSSGKLYLLDADGLDDGFDGEDNVERLAEWEWRSNVTFENFTLSPHNFQVTDDGYVHLGHYHGGTRFLEIERDPWALTERGYFRAARDVPEASKMEGLNSAAPFTWCAVEHEGVTYAADVNTGVYALRFAPDSGGDLKGAGVGAVAAGVAGLGGLLYRLGRGARGAPAGLFD